MPKVANKEISMKHYKIIGSIVIVALVIVSLVFIQNKKTNNNDSDTDNISMVEGQANPVSENEQGNIVINTSKISQEATFYQYNTNGTTMEFFAVKASDGTIRTALNTCQICQGSPYAYFEQNGDAFQCQNCGNIFYRDKIELQKNGCNPIPITGEIKEQTDTEITISADELEEMSSLFTNWKKF